jgi:hypothetical protein
MGLIAAPPWSSAAPPQINGHLIDPETYRLLVTHGFLPTRATFLSNEELARKFDLSLPQLANIKRAVERRDQAALEKAVIAYLDSKLPPLKPAKPPRPAPGANHPEMRYRPEAWLGKEIAFIVNDQVRTYPVGERVNWFRIGDGEPDVAGWSTWGNILAEAYLASGDPKYARGLLTYIRAFYRDCRPPAQRTTSWSGALGPWAVGGRGRAMGLLQWLYQVLGGSPVITDADRTMFLKMIYEHGEVMYLFSEEHQVTNFEFYPISVLSLLARTFPEFKDSKAWRERARERVLQNMEDSLLDDGGAQERSQYNGAYLSQYTQFYRLLLAQGAATPGLRRKLESMYDWYMWFLPPTYQYPNINLGQPTDVSDLVSPAAELFAERPELVYFASRRARGKPPSTTARVLAHSGFLTMRSRWSADALYMVMNYNGSLPEIPGTYPDLLSFGLWAHGCAYLTNAGTPVSYAHPTLRDWCAQTKASNTVLVDGTSQQTLSNGGRLEDWQAQKRFTYLKAATDNYRHLRVNQRRSVLFLQPDYWVMHDRLEPLDKAGPVHDYRWQAHFQPMDVRVERPTMTITGSAQPGKRLYIVPNHPELLQLEQGKGIIADGVHTQEKAVSGPYVRFIQKSDQPVSFAVVLYPAANDMPAPKVSSCNPPVVGPGVSIDDAVGMRIRHGQVEDTVVLAESAGLRLYSPLRTDGVAAYVRTQEGKILEAGLVGGRQLDYDGKPLLRASRTVASASLRYHVDKTSLDIRGHGKLAVRTGAAERFLLNRRIVPKAKDAAPTQDLLQIEIPDPGPLPMDGPAISTDATAIYKALVGFRPGSAVPPWNPILVSWKTPIPSDATIEYAPEGTRVPLRTTRPDLRTEHRLVLNRLAPGTVYQIRIRSTAEDGRSGERMLTYRR